jgi:DNA-binding NtrC family response regulator
VAGFAVDVRILSATNRDLQSLVDGGTFRQDLLYRLNGVTVTVPPLRDRPHEILALARALLARAVHEIGVAPPAFTRAAEAALVAHAWPGNVRELRNVVERAVVLSEGGAIDVGHLLLAGTAPAAPTLGAKMDAFERDQIARALAEADGNQTRAAALLGMSRRALINRIEAYGLPRPRKS